MEKIKEEVNSANVSFFKGKLGLLAFSVTLFLTSVFLLFLLSPWQQIKTIKINSIQATKSDILTELNLKTPINRTLIVFQNETLNNRLKNSSNINSITTKINSKNQLIINVNETLVGGFIKNDSTWNEINKQGKITKKNILPTGIAPIYTNFGSQTELENTINQYFKTDGAVRNSISQIIFAPSEAVPDRIILIMADNNIVYAQNSIFYKKLDFYPEMVANVSTKDYSRITIDITGNGFARAFNSDDQKNIDTFANE